MELEEAIKDIKRICEYLKESDYMSIDKDTKISLETLLNHLAKQEKLIELMSKSIRASDIDEDICQYEGICNEYECEECIKQYFEKKAEE